MSVYAAAQNSAIGTSISILLRAAASWMAQKTEASCNSVKRCVVIEADGAYTPPRFTKLNYRELAMEGTDDDTDDYWRGLRCAVCDCEYYRRDYGPARER